MLFQALPRSLRRLLRRVLPLPRSDFVYSSLYAQGHSAVPADPLRGEQILAFLVAEGLCSRDRIHTPHMASIHSLRRVHADSYLDTLHDEEVLTHTVGVPLGAPEIDQFLGLQRVMAGGTTLATVLARESGRLAVNLGGGLHHAWADRGQGFCLLNDVAVAIASQRAHGFKGRILVVDLDLHHGDGTEAIFAEDPTVFTFSIHNRDWADTTAVASTRVELGDEVDGATYLAAVGEHLPPVVESFLPDLAFYLAGADPAATDRIGDWKTTEKDLLERDLLVLHLLLGGEERVPTVFLLAGGYGQEAWRYPARSLSTWLAKGRPPALPTTAEVTLLRFRMMARMLDPAELSGADESSDEKGRAVDDWQLTEEDLLGPLSGTGKSTRFLDFYSKHGVELALERAGILGRLRARGFPHMHLEWTLDNDSGHTLRLYTDTSREELLAELRVRRSRRRIPGMEVIHVEWLMLQNPREALPPGRSALPGQDHPGLGMLRDVVGLLVVAGERLHLDGISFVPTHYHLAATSQKLMGFLDPQAEARLNAVQKATEGLDLRQASQAVAAGRVVDAATGEAYRWEPTPLVIPLSDRLKSRLEEERRAWAEGSGSDEAPDYRLLPLDEPRQ